jgi:lipoate synthase
MRATDDMLIYSSLYTNTTRQKMGFKYVASGPLVRSSYKAGESVAAFLRVVDL